MERIRKALERASQERASQERARRTAEAGKSVARPTNGNGQLATGDLSRGITYTQTRVLEIPEQVLLDNRLIAGVAQHRNKDSYRMLRTRVLQTMRGNGWTSLAVTGPSAGCGKTLTAINLAISLAMEVTHTVLLVDLDLRKPSIHEYFGHTPEAGIGDYLAGEATVPEMLFSPGIPRLVVLPGREPVSNSSEMLRSPRMLSLINELKTRYVDRLLVFDLPPILAADDALAFSPYVDAILMVAESGKTRKEDLQKATDILKNVPLVGTVLNKSESPTMGYGYAERA